MAGPERDDDYLWDRRGPVDPEIARLERLLAGHGLAPDARRQAMPATTSVPVPGFALARRRIARRAFAAAAVLALCAFGLQAWYQQRLQWQDGRPWQLLEQRGAVRVDGRRATALAPDGVLSTGPRAAARLRAAGIGEVALGPGSRLQLVHTRTGRHRLQLLEGRMRARVWAPPGQFGVDVAGAEVLDLGCEFELDAPAAGDGRLTVRSGWVQVDNGVDEVLVPQGATVRIRRGRAPGTPRDLGATPDFVAALDAIDAHPGGVRPDGPEIRRLLAAARPGAADAISLVSLVQRDPALAQGPMYDHVLRSLAGATLVTRAEIRAHGPAALSPWWQALPYPRFKRWWLKWPDALPGGGGGFGRWPDAGAAPPRDG